MSQPVIVEEPIDEGSSGWNIGQAALSDNSLIQQADVTGDITLKIYERGNATPIYTKTDISVIGGNTVAPLDVINDTPINDGRWGIDDTGYNFAHYFDLAELAVGTELEGGKLYTFVYSFTLDAAASDPGSEVVLRWIWRILANRTF